jgi:hypothetical protein
MFVFRAFKRILQYRNGTRPDIAEVVKRDFSLNFLIGFGNIQRLKELNLENLFNIRRKPLS